MLALGQIAIVMLLIPAAGTSAWAEEEPLEARATINFIYMSVNDINAMRHFYTDLVGLHETNYKEGPKGWLVYKCEGFQFMLFPSGHELQTPDGWGMQPGWPGGTLDGTSWSIIIPGEQFEEVVKALIADKSVTCLHEEPQWCQWSYWSFPVLDPMGNTVEVHQVPEGEQVQERKWEWSRENGGQ